MTRRRENLKFAARRARPTAAPSARTPKDGERSDVAAEACFGAGRKVRRLPEAADLLLPLKWASVASKLRSRPASGAASGSRQGRALQGTAMRLSNESLLVILAVGLIAGWLAGKIVRGAGYGLVGDIAIGVVGAFVGDWLLPRFGIHLGSGMINLIVNATIGAT